MFELRVREGALQSGLHAAVQIPIKMQGILSCNGEVADFQRDIEQVGRRLSQFYRLQFLRHNNDTQLLQLVQPRVSGIESGLFELIRGYPMAIEGFQAIDILGLAERRSSDWASSLALSATTLRKCSGLAFSCDMKPFRRAATATLLRNRKKTGLLAASG